MNVDELTDEEKQNLFEVYLSGFVSGAASHTATVGLMAGRSQAEVVEMADRASNLATDMAKQTMATDEVREGVWQVIADCLNGVRYRESGTATEVGQFLIEADGE